ncbi:MAG: hypothetical protein CSYNP_02374 [Syntrophus sp. SKADARSKE-3]|nr:hypothetical protein [Syntrophus sp. SKADARSKE-3]
MQYSDPTFTILALGAFTPLGESGYSARLVPAETPSLEEALGAFSPRLWIPVPTAICPDGGLTLAPRRIEDLHPDDLIRTVPYLKDLYDAMVWIGEAMGRGLTPEDMAAWIKDHWRTLPLNLSLGTKPAATRSAVDDLLSMVELPGSAGPPDSGSGGPAAWKRQIEQLLADNLACVFADPSFRAFEAAWRGAEVVLRQGIAQGGQGTRMYLASVSPAGLEDALESIADDAARILPNLIVVDMPFDQSPRCLDMLDGLARFAENLLAPAAVWVRPSFLHLGRWDELHRLPLLQNHIETAAYAKWRKLMARQDGCWLVAVGNRFLSRLPYGSDNRPRSVFLEERELLWVSPVWAVAALAAQSIEIFGWPSRFSDAANIRLRQMTVFDIPDRGRSVTEGAISEERVYQLIDIGVTALTGAPEKEAVFIPRETTVAGESLGFQMFLSRVIAFLIRCRDQFSAGPEELSPEKYVYEALVALFRRTGYEPPSDLSVEAGDAEAYEPVPLAIAFSPPPPVRIGDRQIAFTFSW